MSSSLPINFIRDKTEWNSLVNGMLSDHLIVHGNPSEYPCYVYLDCSRGGSGRDAVAKFTYASEMKKLVSHLGPHETGVKDFTVQQAWMSSLTWKQQTVILAALRGPDHASCKAMKNVSRWMRSVCLENADPKHTYMDWSSAEMDFQGVLDEIEYSTVHFATHFLYGLQIISYKHPLPEVSKMAFNLYQTIVVDGMHLNIETKAEMEERLSDRS